MNGVDLELWCKQLDSQKSELVIPQRGKFYTHSLSRAATATLTGNTAATQMYKNISLDTQPRCGRRQVETRIHVNVNINNLHVRDRSNARPLAIPCYLADEHTMRMFQRCSCCQVFTPRQLIEHPISRSDSYRVECTVQRSNYAARNRPTCLA